MRLRAILSPALAGRRVFEVRSAPANPFDNTEKSVPVRAVSLVRNGDNGGETGIRTLGTLSRSTVFKTAAFDHSATSPVLQIELWCGLGRKRTGGKEKYNLFDQILRE